MKSPAKRLAIVAAQFNQKLMDAMIEVAQVEAKALGASIVRVVRVPGTFEIPLIADVQLESADVDALVVLGYIERGETLHGEVMGHVVFEALINLQLKYRKPIGIGIIGPGATPKQAQARKKLHAQNAVRAALRLCEILAESDEVTAPF